MAEENTEKLHPFDKEKIVMIKKGERGSFDYPITVPKDGNKSIKEVVAFVVNYCKERYPEYLSIDPRLQIFEKSQKRLLYQVIMWRNGERFLIYFDPTTCFKEIKSITGDAQREILRLEKNAIDDYEMTAWSQKTNMLGHSDKPIIIDPTGIKNMDDIDKYRMEYCKKNFKDYAWENGRILNRSIAGKLYYLDILTAGKKRVFIYFDPTDCFEKLKKKDKRLAAEIMWRIGLIDDAQKGSSSSDQSEAQSK